MNNTIFALIGYLSLTLLLMFWLGGYRSVQVMRKQRAVNGFKADGSDQTPFGQRLTRALGNCMESFSLIGGVILLALATNSAAVTNGLALYLLGARLGQSITHLVSNSPIAVQIRFGFFAVQLLILVYWLYLLALKFM